MLVIDSTGIKLSNRGEWIKEKHGEKSRKGWVKLHVAMDLKTHQVVDIEITDEKVSDSQVGIELVKDSYRALQEQGKRIVKVLADKGYDTYEMFERLKQMGIEPAIMIRNNARVNVNGYNYSYRNHIVKQIKKNQEQWIRKVNYHQRWHIESFFLLLKGFLVSMLLVKHQTI